MASIVGKRRGQHTYYYLVESARVDGKPRIVSQEYLGTAEEVMAKLAGAASGEPVRSQHKQFGNLAAVWSILEAARRGGDHRRVVAARRADAALSVGTYIALAAANRVVAPCSKLALADWWATTAGDRWGGPRAAHWTTAGSGMRWIASTPTRWGASNRVWWRPMVAEYGLDLSGLVLDMTNFATYIEFGQRPRPESPSAATPNRNAPTCASSAWRWW